MTGEGRRGPIIRPANADADSATVRAIIMPVIRAGETYALARSMSAEEALAWWFAPDKESFIAESGGKAAGAYYLRPNQAGGGSHVANCGYMVSEAARGAGIARAMCLHSMNRARERGFAAMQFNFVVSANAAAVGLWQSLGFEIVGRLPGAFDHPSLGLVDALVMYRGL